MGPESDALLKTLDQLHGSKLNPAAMTSETRFAGISLEGDPARLERGPVKIKVFFESTKDELYAEAFINIDLGKRRLALREKDPEYRAALVKALQGSR